MTNRQLALDLSFRPALGREDFLVAPCNQAAVAWVDSWPVWPGTGLCVWGSASSGKSHLGEAWRAVSGAARLSTEQLCGGVADRTNYTLVDLGEDQLPRAAEEPLLHLYNWMRDQGRHLMLLARTPPARWQVELPDLRSRLNAVDAVQIEEPDDALLAGLLVKLFGDRHLEVEPDLIVYALSRMERSFAGARQLVETVDRDTLASRRAVTVRLLRSVLAA